MADQLACSHNISAMLSVAIVASVVESAYGTAMAAITLASSGLRTAVVCL
jgi:hypothetical protein